MSEQFTGWAADYGWEPRIELRGEFCRVLLYRAGVLCWRSSWAESVRAAEDEAAGHIEEMHNAS